MWRAGYTLILWLLLPYVLARLWWRGRKEPGYRRDIGERFGRYQQAASKPVIWLHAVSMGETRAAEPLARALLERHPDCEIVITQMTATGRDTARQLFGERAILGYLPYDYPFAVRRFLEHFRPRLGVLMETEIWPNLVRQCALAGVPLLLANARLSEKSARGYARLAPLARSALERISAVAAQTEEDAARLERLGARSVEVTGNLKFDMAPAAGTEELARELRRGFGARRVLLAASTREGEEALLLEALGRGALPGAIVAIVPRHPQRFDEVAALLERRGLAFVRRSENRALPPDCNFFLGDSLGEMGAYCAAADLAFIGGSLLAFGAQNLIEACAAGAPVLIGPSTYNFAQAAEEAIRRGAALGVRDAGDLVACARRLLADDQARARMSAAGVSFCAEHRGATARLLAICERLLPAPAPAGAPLPVKD
ncbi:MAG: lipid IV(A) 3-deoxy-D-manno-octulosonic acid transferase [Betaproteobacteria bacterium]|nr:lipid IV(A) 3-deoxy-D-manno-octulosonic acid transferase [Betaproteobacteria bacterium]